MQKYFRIGEIAELYNICTDSLRHYEKMGILSPVRGANDYRMYSLSDIWRLNVIRELRELGLSLKQVGDYLSEHSTSSTVKLLEEEVVVIQERIRTLNLLGESVQKRLHSIDRSTSSKIGIVQEVKHEKRKCHMIKEGYESDEEMDVIIKQLLNIDSKNLYVVGNNQIGSRIPLENVQNSGFRKYDAVFILDDNGNEIITGGHYLTISYKGDCSQNYEYIPMLTEYAKEYNLKLKGPVLEIILIDIHVSSSVEEHITELQVLVG